MAPNLLQMIFTFVFGDASSIKSVLTRGVSVLIVIIAYFAITYQSEIATYLKEAPVQQYTETVIQKRQQLYPILAKERAVMLNSTLNPASVVILEYHPNFTNNDLMVVAQEGRIKVDWKYISVDKMSNMYQSNLLGEGFFSDVDKVSNPIAGEELVLPAQLLRYLNIKYTFAYPIFNLANSYSGAILILWDSDPSIGITGQENITRRLRLIVLPSARALGRAK